MLVGLNSLALFLLPHPPPLWDGGRRAWLRVRERVDRGTEGERAGMWRAVDGEHTIGPDKL